MQRKRTESMMKKTEGGRGDGLTVKTADLARRKTTRKEEGELSSSPERSSVH